MVSISFAWTHLHIVEFDKDPKAATKAAFVGFNHLQSLSLCLRRFPAAQKEAAGA